MSRIGKMPIEIPEGVKVNLNDNEIKVEGPHGSLAMKHHKLIKVSMKDNLITVEPVNDEPLGKSLHGLTRTLISNMIEGVKNKFEKKLEVQGVGYKAQMKGKGLVLNLGYSHTIEVNPPEDITIAVEENIITVTGIDKQKVGDISSNIRAFRKPEPYKGKGIRYVGEYVPRKEGKKVVAAT